MHTWISSTRLIGFLFTTLLLSVVHAQPDVGNIARNGASISLLSADVFDQAKSAAATGNIAAAETLLVAQVASQDHSFAWQVDCGRALIRLTISLGAEGQIEAQRAAATRALSYLAEAENTAANAAALSNLRTTEGMLQERYLADPVAAKASYQRALAASSTNALATAAIVRLNQIDASARARVARKTTGG